MRPINNKSSPAVPKLRFPEFVGAGGWEVKKLESVLDVIIDNRGKTPPITREKYIPLIEVNSMRGTNIDYKKVSKFVTLETFDSWFRKYLKNGDILFSTVGNTAVCSIYFDKVKAVIAQNIVGLRFTSQNFKFMFYLLTEEKNNHKFKRIEMGAVQPSVKVSQMIHINFLIPLLSEQQKIADCLSSFDALITTQTQKLQALQQHKKGLMQNLFPAEGKTTPKLRFPEFVKEGEWVERKLGEIGEPLMCKRAFKEQTTTNPDNSIPFYKIGTFGREPDSYISIDLYNEFRSKYSFPNKGDILISASGTIGRLVVYDGSPAYFQDSNIVWLDNNEELILNSLLFYCYSILNWQTSDGGVIKRLYNSDLRNIQIRFPIEKTEQQKIADCLSSFDALITTQTQKLQALQQHKKGLMQGLFPIQLS